MTYDSVFDERALHEVRYGECRSLSAVLHIMCYDTGKTWRAPTTLVLKKRDVVRFLVDGERVTRVEVLNRAEDRWGTMLLGQSLWTYALYPTPFDIYDSFQLKPK